MVAPLKSLELTATQIIRILIQTRNLKDGRWTWKQAQTGSTQY